MFESVYVCRNTNGSLITIVPARIGIVKLKGCVQFFCAIKNSDGKYGYIYDTSGEDYVPHKLCRDMYSSVPPDGTAWLVEEGRKYINWTQVDQNMHLLNADGSIVKSK